MDGLDAFDRLYGTYVKATALLKAALDYEELNGPDDVPMTIVETSLEMMQSARDAWDVLEKEICRPREVEQA